MRLVDPARSGLTSVWLIDRTFARTVYPTSAIEKRDGPGKSARAGRRSKVSKTKKAGKFGGKFAAGKPERRLHDSTSLRRLPFSSHLFLTSG